LAAQSASEGSFIREQFAMNEVVVELTICLCVGLLSLAVVAWDVASGRIVYLDGIALAIIVLTIGLFFLFNVFWSYRTGELAQLWKDLRKPKATDSGHSTPPAA